MAQMQRQPDSPRTQAIPNALEQILKGHEGSKSSTKSPLSSASMSSRDHDLDNDHGSHHKRTVLMKMKDKAKKLRNSFKKRNGEDIYNVNSSSGATHDEEEEEEEEDAEYHGAPMYGSELASNERNHHHQDHKMFSDKNVLSNINTKSTMSDREKSESQNNDFSPTKPPPSPTKGVASIKSPSPQQLINQTKMIAKLPSPRKEATPCAIDSTSCPSKIAASGSAAETGTDKQAPAYPAVSDETHAIASKMKRVSISKPVVQENSSTSAPAPSKYSSEVTRDSSTSLSPDSYPVSAPAGAAKEADHSKDQQFDKGVSVKEYIINKFEPGEDEKALSRVISDVMTPRKSLGNVGVVDKVREAVSSLLRHEDSSDKSMDTQSANFSSPQIPVSSNPHEVCDEEENQGRILQAN